MKGRTNAGGSILQIPLDVPTALTAIAGNAKVSLTWTDPKDKYATPEGEQAQDPQQLVSKWAYTKIVRKVGSAPTGPNDGVAVVSSEVRNAYQTNPFVDTGVENDVTYYYAAYAYNESYIASDGTVSDKATPKDITIYGVEWNGTDTTKWTRIGASADFPDPSAAVANGEGSSPFDDLMPWAGMVVSENPKAGTVVAIPKFWYKWTELNPGLRLEISTDGKEGFFVSPAHCDRGDGAGERDVVYVGRYHCVSDNGYKSLTGKIPTTNQSRTVYRMSINSAFDNTWLWDWAMSWTIKMLYLVEFADWNSQKCIGIGGTSTGAKVENGKTDAMAYHTGTSGETRESPGTCQYRHIEGLWDNVFDYVDGFNYANAAGASSAFNYMHISINPSEYADLGNYSYLGKWGNCGSVVGGWSSAFVIKTFFNNQWLVPTANKGSESTYITDSWGTPPTYNNEMISIGGDYYKSGAGGLFRVLPGVSSSNVGARLMVLP